MERTGERYGAARRVLIEQAGRRDDGRHRVSEPEMSDEKVRAATGRGWDEWCDLIDAWPGHSDGHPAVATWVNGTHGVDGWWSQAVTNGWERITGRRLPNQMPDGTFTANKSRTVRCDHEVLRTMLLDDDLRGDLFPGHETALRSRRTSKSLRVAIGAGIALLAIEPRRDGRVTVTVSHEQLPDSDAVEEWKFYWDEWLTALDDG